MKSIEEMMLIDLALIFYTADESASARERKTDVECCSGVCMCMTPHTDPFKHCSAGACASIAAN
jgi:hypothetical protein